MVIKNKRAVSVFTLAVMILLATTAISGRCYAANRAEEILKKIVTVKDMPAGFTLERTNQHTDESGSYESASKQFKGKHPFYVSVNIEQNLELSSTVYVYDDLIKSLLRADSEDIIARDLGFGEQSVHSAWRWLKSDPFYTSQTVRVFWRNWKLDVIIAHYAHPQVKAFTDESARNWVKALAAEVFDRFLNVDERIKFEKIEQNPEDALVVKVTVREKIFGQWRVPQEPVYISLHMQQGHPDENFLEDQLIDAYRAARPTPQPLVFEAESYARYKTDNRTGTVDIILRKGSYLGAPGQRRRGGDQGFSYVLSAQKVLNIWRKLNERMHPHKKTRLIAHVELRAYTINEKGYYDVEATGSIPIQLDHVAKILRTDAKEETSSGVEVMRPNIGSINKFDPSEMGRKLDLKEHFKLIPDDKIELGVFDGVKLHYVLTDEKWIIRANANALRGGNRSHAEIYICPSGGPPLTEYVKDGVAWVAATGAIAVAVWASGGWAVLKARIIGSVIVGGSVKWIMNRWVFPETTIWSPVIQGGTIVGFDMGATELGVFLFEGGVSVGDSSGGQVTLSKGHTIKVSATGLSQPVKFVTENLSHQFKSALEDVVRGSQPGTGTLLVPDVQVTGLRFYEGGSKSPPLDKRRYAERFPRSETQSVWFELHLEYPEPGRRIEFPIESVWYGPDGGVLGRKSFGGHVKADWDDSFHWDCWRPGDKGAWEPGEYRVEVFMAGQKITSGFYEITEGETESTNIPIPDAKVVGVKFYESGYDNTPFGQRTYKERFSKSESRYVNWELGLIFPPPGRRIDFDIDAVWYRPDGSVVARQTKKAYVESAWMDSFHNLGWGWKSPGNWQPGKYRVELFILDGQKIAEGFFEIGNL